MHYKKSIIIDIYQHLYIYIYIKYIQSKRTLGCKVLVNNTKKTQNESTFYSPSLGGGEKKKTHSLRQSPYLLIRTHFTSHENTLNQTTPLDG